MESEKYEEMFIEMGEKQVRFKRRQLNSMGSTTTTRRLELPVSHSSTDFISSMQLFEVRRVSWLFS